jgi:hypothetical protein
MTPKKETKTKGTTIAEKARARSNALTGAERQRNLAKAMTLIYGGEDKASVRRG